MIWLTESVVEDATLAWLESIGWSVTDGVEIGPGEPAAERDNYGQVVLAQRLRDAFLREVITGMLCSNEAARFIGRAVS